VLIVIWQLELQHQRAAKRSETTRSSPA